MPRLDQEMFTRGLARSRAHAQALIADGVVLVDGEPARKASQKVSDERITLTDAAQTWVSRAALKLVHALDHFSLDPSGAVTADIGASTGGFSQVLLERGAAHVHAVDVGHGQMAHEIAADPRVTLYEGVNARDMSPDLLPDLDWVVCDVSFISATKALPVALSRVRAGGTLVCLVKPQFEVGPAKVGKGGIISDPAARAEACETLIDFVEAQGWIVLGLTQSPITGGDGNVEFLLAARKA